MEQVKEQKIAFEYKTDFVYAELQKCALGELVYGPLFITRHGSYFFKWKLNVCPKEKDNKLGLYLKPIDRQQNISVQFDLFCGNEKKLQRRVFTHELKKDEDWGKGTCQFLPSVDSLKDKMLMVDGVLTMGVKVILKASDFDPLKWVPMPSLTPDTGRIVRKHFSNLIAGNRRGSDFTIVVGIGARKKKLYVNKVPLEGVPFFDRLFGDTNDTGDGWKENSEESMTLPTFSVGAVKEALRFVYLNEIGQNLTRFGSQLLDLANQWELTDLKTAIERDMIKKLLSNRVNFNLAAEYFELVDRYDQEVLRRVAICRLIEMWAKFANSPTGLDMDSYLKDEVIECGMSTVPGGFFI